MPSDRIAYSTIARRVILTYLRHDRRYLGASQIHREVRGVLSRIALSTVYRTLEYLSEQGSLSRRNVNGVTEYLFCGDLHHDHAVCRICGRVDDVDCIAMNGVRAELRARLSFALDDHEFTFYGRCAACQASESTP